VSAAGTPEAGPLAAVRGAMAAGRPADVLQESEAILATATDPAVVVEATAARASALTQVGRPGDAFALLRSARDQQKAAGRPTVAATLSVAESGLRTASGDLPAAISALIEAANDYGAAGDMADQIRAELQLVTGYLMASQPDNARQVMSGCLGAAQRLGDPGVLAEVRHQEGSLLLATGADPVASFEDGLRAADRSGSPVVQIQLRIDLGRALARQDAGRAVTLLSQAERIAAGLGDPLAGANGLAAVGQGWWALGRANDGIRCADRALGLLDGAGAWPLMAGLAVSAADMSNAAGRRADAQRYAGAAVAAGGRIGGPGGQASVMVMLGEAAAQRGDRQTAHNAFGDAVRRLQAAALPVPPQLSAALSELGQRA